MVASAAVDSFRVHSAVDDPDRAELILFVETGVYAGHYFEDVRRHPLYNLRQTDSYLFCSTDRFVPMLPGVYASVERSWYWPNWTRSGHYVNVTENGHLTYDSAPVEREYLFSFIGSTKSHAVRRRLMSLEPRDALLLDTFAGPGDPGMTDPLEYERRYADALRKSAFILCPRGGGTSSFRLFETMMLGRAPVIISDQWVPPEGPDWGSFSVRVPESEIRMIPDLLAQRASDAQEMGEAARAAWLEWFSPQASFHRVVESCLELAACAPARAGVRGYAPRLQMLRPFHAARWLAKRAGHGRESP